MSEDKGITPHWEVTRKRAVWIPALVALIAMIGSVGGAALTWSNKGRELDIRMIDISLSILKGDDRGTQPKEAKLFALRVLERYSGVRIPDEERVSWAETTTGLQLGELPNFNPYTEGGDTIGFVGGAGGGTDASAVDLDDGS